MRYLRLFSVLLLSTFTIIGCHRRRERIAPPQQAQAPIVTTLPPIPPLTFPDVQIEKPKPKPPVVQAAAPPKPPEKPAKKVHHHHPGHKAEPETAIASTETANSPHPDSGAPAPESGAAVLGQLSADDSATNPHQNVQTQHLIQETEDRLKKISSAQQEAHKNDIAQVNSFLAQAKQALGINDIVGAETLANKAKILLDELLK